MKHQLSIRRILNWTWITCIPLLLLCCRNKSSTGATPCAEASPTPQQCAECHPHEYEEWANSDHAWAARLPNEQDAPAFRGQMMRAHGDQLIFRRDESGRYLVQTSWNEPALPVVGAVGRDPLVQYLVPGKRGALQVLSAAWDPQRHEWFDVFADDARLKAEGNALRKPGDWGHFTGRGMTWNSQCAACHMTGYRKKFDRLSDGYHSSFEQMGVTCIACHPAAKPDPIDGCTADRRTRTLTPQQASAVCASCHARAETFDDTFRPGDRFEDHYRLELPVAPGVFYATGMQRDEVFVETGFRLSRMGAAGVTCMDCHDPHTGETILPWEDNSLCLRCHAIEKVINGKKAPFSAGAPEGTCDRESIGGRCVECHMPESNYMARDPRRDHSLNIPDPVLSQEIGAPNACTMCHRDKNDEWAAQVLARAIPHQIVEQRRPRARAVHAAMHGQAKENELLNALQKEDIPAWRATLLEHLSRCPLSPAIQQAAQKAATDADALVRAAAAGIPGPHVTSLLHDPIRSVRHAAVWSMIQVMPERLNGTEAAQELREAAEFRADQPGGTMLLATLAQAAGNIQEAEEQYRRAIALDPSSPVPYMDYALLLARTQRLQGALQALLTCTKVAPKNAEAQYRLALVLAELGLYPAAIIALDRALQADPQHAAARAARAELTPFLSPKP